MNKPKENLENNNINKNEFSEDLKKKENSDKKSDLLDFNKFNENTLANIWKCSKEKKESYEDFKLIYTDIEENENHITLLVNKDKQSNLFQFYKNPVELKIEEKEFNLYTFQQCNSILSKFCLNDYSIFVNDLEIKNDEEESNKDIDIETIKSINIKKMKYSQKINEEEFKKYIIRPKIELPLKESIIKVNKKCLSLYFDDICFTSDKNEDSIDLILDKNRIEFINNLNEFLISSNAFYLILGNHGIGKTITFLYYTSSIINKYRKLYINLKLFLNNEKDKNKLKEIFYDEIKRLFLINKEKEIFIESFLEQYKELIDNIDNANLEKNEINYFWQLLFTFIQEYDKNLVDKVLIILDQYKVNKIDENFKNLNNLCKMIRSSVFKNKFKLVILVSINNYDTKEIFLENLNYVSFYPLSDNNVIPSPRYRTNIEEQIEYDTTNNDANIENNYELEDIEKFLNEKQEEFQTKFKEMLNQDTTKIFLQPSKIPSKLELNSTYGKVTKKVYINEIVSCKNLVNSNMNKNYLNCLEVFGYSLKYYSLLLGKIKSTTKKKDESEDEFAKNVVQNFYIEMANKITRNLDSFYLSLFKKYPNYLDIKRECLKLLYENIYEEKVYSLKDMRDLLLNNPIKYLNIYIVGSENMSIPLDTSDISKYKFFFDFTNFFVRETIYKYYLRDTSLYNQSMQYGGSGFGAVFEESVNKALLAMNDEKETIKRNVFSLVGTKTKSYIEKLRKKEDLVFYDFYELKVLNVLIDGVDNDKVTKEDLDILKYDVYLNQISKSGKSFDSGILKKKPKSFNMNDIFTHDLILCQDTKQKIKELKEKNDYVKDGNLVKKFLQDTYENLQIDKIYLIFILPYGLNTFETVSLLNQKKLYYVFFNLNQKNFLSKENIIINDFRIPEAEIKFDDSNFDLLTAFSNINISKYILNKSIRNFLGKKRIYDNKFYNIYNKVSQENSFNCISLLIPIELKLNIIKKLREDGIFTEDNIINFIPSTNCNLYYIEDIFIKEKIMFIFSYHKNIYLYYNNYYLINKDYSIDKVNFELDKNKKSKCKIPPSNIKAFTDILFYPLFCFGFTVIKNHMFDY